jgi:sarcosine oxidase
MTTYDVIVVGAGAVGCATARALALAGREVLLLEQGDFPNPHATSYGTSRIFRLAYHEGAAYVPLLEYSLDVWQDLSAAAGQKLFHTTGSLTIGPSDGESFTNARGTCGRHDLAHEVLDAADIEARFPAYDLPEGYRGVYQPHGGLLDPERSLRAFFEEALEAGATIRAREPVTDWRTDGDTAIVETAVTDYTAEALVVASGAWAADQVDAVADLLRRERHVACRLLPARRPSFTVESFPAFVIDTADGGHYYGLPEHRLPGFKIGATHVEGAPVHPDAASEPARSEAAPVRSFVSEFLPAGDGPLLGLRSCVLSHSPDGDYIVDSLPGADNVVLAVGMSGHGFKNAPAVGGIAAAKAINADPPLDPEPFSLARFDGSTLSEPDLN